MSHAVRRELCLVAGLLLLVCVAVAQAPADKAPETLAGEQAAGWRALPGTELASVCPGIAEIRGNDGCQAVISAWNGGIADTKNNRLIFFGGGHFDYYGNEVYALDLSKGALERIVEPSPVTNLETCPESYTDGHPSARHTYNGLAYLAAKGALYMYGGAKSPCGGMSDVTWLLDLASLQWTRKDPHGENPFGAPGAAADYDRVSGLVYMTDTRSFFSYDSAKNSYAKLGSYYGLDYHMTAVMDPERRLFLMFGGAGQMWSIDVRRGSKYELKDLSKRQHGCEALSHAAYPGLAYDEKEKAVVGWAGGDSVYIFNAETSTCRAMTFPGGPGPAQQNGTEGRFRYFPALDLFALVNDWKKDAYALRLGAVPTQR